jgi:hypothetical protein
MNGVYTQMVTKILLFIVLHFIPQQAIEVRYPAFAVLDVILKPFVILYLPGVVPGPVWYLLPLTKYGYLWYLSPR